MSQESKQEIAEQIVRVRENAHARLSQVSRLDPGDCQESYLFEDDHFCGIKFWLGAFHADWLVKGDLINFYRGKTSIGHLELAATDAKRAA